MLNTIFHFVFKAPFLLQISRHDANMEAADAISLAELYSISSYVASNNLDRINHGSPFLMLIRYFIGSCKIGKCQDINECTEYTVVCYAMQTCNHRASVATLQNSSMCHRRQ